MEYIRGKRLLTVHTFKSSFEKVHTRNLCFQNSASKMSNCIIVDIVNYLMLLLANS